MKGVAVVQERLEPAEPDAIWEPVAGVVDAEVSASLSADGTVVFRVLVGSPEAGPQRRARIELIINREYAEAVVAVRREDLAPARTVTIPATTCQVGVQPIGSPAGSPR